MKINPWAYQLAEVPFWRFFGTLTYQNRVGKNGEIITEFPEQKMRSRWLILVRTMEKELGLNKHNSLWALRSETGGLKGRKHWHFLFGGKYAHEHKINPGFCFFAEHIWRIHGGGHPQIRLYSRKDHSVEYIAKSLGEDSRNLSAKPWDAYEAQKFDHAPELVISGGVMRLLKRRATLIKDRAA